ncbi:MAG: DNA translocase FtsK 4TM domain-containing protein [Rhodobacteraceae bacterium]|nr:DNA translocase FtsK 4TM domain-containing protein [Paracoccaceae bacterium]
MAYHQARQRDPLLETHMQEAIQRRGKELLGLIFGVVGILTILMLASYSPEDPSWLSATDEPVRNLLGKLGASIASPLTVTIGWAGWGLAVVALVWGARFFFHFGDQRFFSRIIFSPIAIALAAVFASTHAPMGDWPHSFGLGGLFGDTALAAIIGVSPFSVAFTLRALSALSGLLLILFGGFVLGSNRAEARLFGRFLIYGVVMAYAGFVALLGMAGLRAVQAAKSAHAHHQAKRAEHAAEEKPAPAVDARAAAKPVDPRLAFVRRQPSVTAATPEIVPRPAPPSDVASPTRDRIRSRIAEAIHQRKSAPKHAEPPLHRSTLVAPEPEDDFDADDFGPDPLIDDTEPYVPPTPESRAKVQHRPAKAMKTSRKAASEAQPSLAFDEMRDAYEVPPLNLLANPTSIVRHHLSDSALEENARMLENVLDDYGVKGEIVSVSPGPVVTMYELEPAPGLKASRVIGLADDIARSMSALAARVSTVPGRSVIGIELPNAHREKVLLREILSARDFGDTTQKLPLALGKNIAGEPVVASLAKMPHLLIAGTTGSGKSVAINTMILSLLYKLTPDECRMIMIDPKMLELSVYDGIPHLLSPVVTDPKKAVVALKWVVGEMEERYRKMSRMGVRNIDGYNGRVKDALSRGENFCRTVQTGFDDDTGEPVFETEEFTPESMPYIVVVVDEMADLMMVAGKEIEACIQRLAQMARASGIHLIMATQRPSVDVITGTIKANFPTRISFQVTSKIDSRTILGEMGAEQLLGMGDMLYMAGGGKITRVHGPFVSDEEVEEIVNHLKSFGSPEYVSGVVEGHDDERESDIDLVLGLGGNTDGEDALYDTAVQIVLKDRKCSTSYIQRKLAIGYNKAARLVEQMEESGLVSPANHVGKRDILVPEGQ